MASNRQLIYARLNRAHGHLLELRRQERGFLGQRPKPYALSVKYNRRSREHLLWVEVRAKPPLDFSFRMCEYIHQLRSTLDNIAWAMALRHLALTRQLREPSVRTAFPVCYTAQQWADPRTAAKLRDLPPASHHAIERLQPFTRMGVGGARFHRLWLLDRMWNTDKHRVLVLALGSSWSLKANAWTKPVVVRWLSVRGFEQSGPVCRVFAHGERGVHYRAQLAFPSASAMEARTKRRAGNPQSREPLSIRAQ